MLNELIGPVVYEEEARGRTIADYAIVRVPIYLTEEEQAEFDELSRSIRHYVATRRREDGAFDWAETAKRRLAATRDVHLVVAVPRPLAVRAGRLPATVLPFKRRLLLRNLLPRLEAFRRR